MIQQIHFLHTCAKDLGNGEQARNFLALCLSTNAYSTVNARIWKTVLGNHETVSVLLHPDKINSYNLLEIEEKDLEDFDFTSLFTIYSDGVSQKVTKDMIDKSSLENISQDGIYTIKVNYTVGKNFKIWSKLFSHINLLPQENCG